MFFSDDGLDNLCESHEPLFDKIKGYLKRL